MIPIFIAAECGDVKKVDQLLSENPGEVYMETDYKGRTALHLAVEHGHCDVVDVLIGHGVNLDAKDFGGFTALHLAAELGYDKIVARLLEKMPKLADQKACNGLTCLHLAAARGHVTIVKRILDNVENKMGRVLDTEKSGRSALDLADAYGHMAVVSVLVESVRSKIDEARTMFDRAVKFGSEQGAIQLLVQNPELVDCVYSYGRSALHHAAQSGSNAVVLKLLAMRPHLAEVGGNYNHDLLHFAAEYGCDTLAAELLVEKPHLLDVRGHRGETLLHLAARCGRKKVVSQLLAAKPALAHQVEEDGQTALHCAAFAGQAEVVTELLAHNPEMINAEDHSGTTPLEWAIRSYRGGACMDSTAACLLAHGATGANPEMIWCCLVASMNVQEDEAVKLMLARQPELIRSVDDFGDNILHYVLGCRRLFQGMFDEEFMLQCWQMNPEALHQTNEDDETPFTNAVRSNNKFAIGLVQSQVPLDEIIKAYAKCKKRFPQSVLENFREGLLLGGLNEDLLGVVYDYLKYREPGKEDEEQANEGDTDDVDDEYHEGDDNDDQNDHLDACEGDSNDDDHEVRIMTNKQH